VTKLQNVGSMRSDNPRHIGKYLSNYFEVLQSTELRYMNITEYRQTDSNTALGTMCIA